jgi:xanthine dehydrogenase small subunit
MRDHIRLLINGREHTVRGRDIFTTLSNYLRYDVGATGTKVVCEEGDCGACTVLIRYSRDEELLPVNSCIQSLFQLDGASIVTVEGLKHDGQLTPVQESMVACHGAQCGYCTPGFIMAMSALFEKCDRVDAQQTREGLVGNLCRCTGYEPIIKAALEVDGASSPKLRERYPDVLDVRDSVRVGDFFAPATLAEAIAFRKEQNATIVQGGTDVGVWINKRNYRAPAMLSLAKIESLKELREEDDAIVAGANVTLSQLEAFVRDRIPELYKILSIFGSPQIKNAGTLVGNIANGSPIGDTLPYLLVADASLEINGGERSVPINSFYLGYKKFDLAPDEIITRVRVPIVRDTLRLYKVSRRRDLDISAFTAAIRLSLAGSQISKAWIAYGGVAPTVVRLPRTEEFLSGKAMSLDLFKHAGRIARDEVKPISDVRGSADYRSQLAENVMAKFAHEVLHPV